MNAFTCICWLALLVSYVTSEDDVADAMLKLTNYGYLKGAAVGTGLLRDPKSVDNAVKRFQVYAGLQATGKLDRPTVAKLKEPRCGMSDPITPKRGKRFVHQGSKWSKQKLTFKIVKYSAYTSRLPQGQVRKTIYATLAKWMKVTNLDFVETASDDADIRIRFVRRNHGDPYAFDGRGGTLAHAFYPMDNKGFAGDAHFDDDEQFTLRSKGGTNFYWVALHEFGHSIGMEHSDKIGAVMYPWYQGYKGDDPKLTRDDVLGIQYLYGARKTKAVVPKLPSTTVTPKKPPSCFGRIKAVILGRDKRTYVMNDDKVYILGTDLMVEEGPIEIGKFFPGLTKVDAAMKAENGDIVFFQGDKYWIYDSQKLRIGPRPITEYGLFADMSNLDGVLSWKGTKKQYFFKGNRFWRFDVGEKSIDPGYPKSMKSWQGIPSNIDSVFQWKNNALYFFKGTQYYRFDIRRIKSVPGYPKRIQGDFIICPKTSIASSNARLVADPSLFQSPKKHSSGTYKKASLGLFFVMLSYSVFF